ncbi:hypothetical protein G210_3107 [Candida maltosa Xu316]|uniref:Maintenance of telomere capping protein 4 n=1 Tax=Candida maltosa (strain Xu316) TaxID=1245528 RepID=M3JW76_CANMX|nr:hypothetical protein G210_3107 [Candida maltosa Xu316]
MSKDITFSLPPNPQKNKRVVSDSLRLSKLDTSSRDQRQSSPKPTTSPSSPATSSTKFPNHNEVLNYKSFNDFEADGDDLLLDSQIMNDEDDDDEAVPSTSQPRVEENHEITDKELRKAEQLASLFIDTRKVLSAERNIIDQKSEAVENHEHEEASTIKISRSTLLRAEKVKATLAVKYLYIQRIYEWADTHIDNNEHLGVEGVYNPLQIIRNRKIRNKYNEHPQPLAHMKTIPLACNVFSSHNLPGNRHHESSSGSTHSRKRHWRMVWAVDLNEFVGDSRWRIHHWNELRGPNGELWFPDTRDKLEPTNSKRKRFVLRHKHNKSGDELQSQFELEDEYDSEVVKHKNQHKKIPSIEGSSSENELQMVKIAHTKNPRRTKIKNKMKKFYTGTGVGAGAGGSGGDSSGSSNALNEFPVDGDENSSVIESDPLGRQLFKRITPPTIDEAPPLELSVPEIRVQPTSPKRMENYDSDMDDLNIKPSIQQVEFTPSTKRVNGGSRSSSDAGGDSVLLMEQTGSEEKQDADEVEGESNNGEIQQEIDQAQCVAIFDERELEFQHIVANLNYFKQCVNLRSNYLSTVYPNHLDVVDKKVKHITKDSVYGILTSISKINDDYLPGYEDLFCGYMEEIKSVIHMVNDVYSVKIDTLLSTNDRSISEINASLSLDLRKITEKLDSLDSSIHKTIFKNALSSTKKNVGNVGMLYKVLYSFLENLIVILLRIVWIVVNIYKVFKFIIVGLWKLIKFVLW